MLIYGPPFCVSYKLTAAWWIGEIRASNVWPGHAHRQLALAGGSLINLFYDDISYFLLYFDSKSINSLIQNHKYQETNMDFIFFGNYHDLHIQGYVFGIQCIWITMTDT